MDQQVYFYSDHNKIKSLISKSSADSILMMRDIDRIAKYLQEYGDLDELQYNRVAVYAAYRKRFFRKKTYNELITTFNNYNDMLSLLK